MNKKAISFSMNKAFTLLELVVVIIILGVLATLGFTQYGKMVERARVAEVKTVMGDIRKLGYAYWLANGTTDGITDADCNIGPNPDQIPDISGCRPSHYFFYQTGASPPNRLRAYAYRCNASGKAPQGTVVYARGLSWNFALGIADVYLWYDAPYTWIYSDWPEGR